MNIVTVTYNSNFHYIRPDISLNRDGNDYFCPDGITDFTVAPFVFIRIDKAGKSVGAKFAQRYYSRIGYGLNLTAKSLIDNTVPQSFFTANSLDNSTYVSELFLPEEFPFNKINESLKQFVKQLQEKSNNPAQDNFLALTDSQTLKEIFASKMEQITKLSSIRTGDFIALELCNHVKIHTDSIVSFGDISFTLKS